MPNLSRVTRHKSWPVKLQKQARSRVQAFMTTAAGLLLLSLNAPTVCRNSENASAPAVWPSFPPALPAVLPSTSAATCCEHCARPPACFSLVEHWSATARTFCWSQKMDRNCDGHGDPSSQQDLNCRQCTDGEAKQQRLYDAGGVHQTPGAEGNSKRKRLRFQIQNKAAEAEASPSQRTRRAFLYSRSRREILVREWGKLGSAIRRAAAVCLSPSTGADEEDELVLPYVQLDKVTRAVRREAFGPLYLVT